MGEWLKPDASKASVPHKGTGGSNPSLSAIFALRIRHKPDGSTEKAYQEREIPIPCKIVDFVSGRFYFGRLWKFPGIFSS